MIAGGHTTGYANRGPGDERGTDRLGSAHVHGSDASDATHSASASASRLAHKLVGSWVQLGAIREGMVFADEARMRPKHPKRQFILDTNR